MRKSIVIVGGGSAGWMSAIYINNLSRQKNLNLEITLVESADIETVGVGEATVPTIREFFQAVGIPEQALLKATNGTIKSAIKFVDWHKKGGSYYHPFEAPLFSDGIEIATHWVSEAKKKNVTEDFAMATGILPTLCEMGKVPKQQKSAQYQGNTLYAYHLDAVLMAKFLREVSLQRGVKRIESTVENVELDDNGSICSLALSNNSKIEGDFFIDCTGFRSLLIEKTLKEPFISFEDELLCNSAVAIQTPYQDNEPTLPYTTATAKSSGWVWDIGLSTRKGNGYVFSDKFQSFESAEKELREHLGPKCEGIEARHLRMRVGYRENTWVKNCLAIGLSAGFVEPLESTGLQFIQLALESFEEHFPYSNDYSVLSNRYNTVMAAKFVDVKEFIVTHYCLTKRDDSAFWKYIKDELVISDFLKERFKLWEYKVPSHADLNDIGLFGAPNYMYILAGMDKLASDKLDISLPSERSKAILTQMKRFRKSAADVLLSHENFLKSV